MMDNSDDNFVVDCERFLSNSENLVDNILTKLNWSKDSIENAVMMATCKYNCQHSLSVCGLDRHESRCALVNCGWSKEEIEALPTIPIKPVVGDGFGKAASSNLFDIEERLQSSINKSSADSDLSSSRYPSRREQELRLLAEVRDIKRKRQSYRVYKQIKTETEIFREIIDHQMELFRELRHVESKMDGISSDAERRTRKQRRLSKHKKHKDKKKKHKHSKSKKHKRKRSDSSME